MALRRRGAAVAWLAVGLVLALSAQALVPRAGRVRAAIARANKDAGRSQALKLELAMRVGDGEPVATGELLIHPTGLARLELRGGSDLRERHLLVGTEHSASRNGTPLSEPRAFLPPLFLLQASSAAMLGTALRSLGVERDLIALAPCGESDCYVLGDPGRIAPPRWVVRPPGHFTTVGETRGAEPVPEQFPAPHPWIDRRELRVVGPPATVWVDVVTYDWKKIETASGVSVWLGPAADFDRVRLPTWILIEEPDEKSVRFEVHRATAVNAPAAVFSRSWLLAPPEARPEEPPPAGALGDPEDRFSRD